MKLGRLLFALFSIWNLSCKQQEATPTGVNGNWLLVQKQIDRNYLLGNGASVFFETIPASPSQTISFNGTNQFSTTITQDTLFSLAHYFAVGSNEGIVGPDDLLIPSPRIHSETCE